MKQVYDPTSERKAQAEAQATMPKEKPQQVEDSKKPEKTQKGSVKKTVKVEKPGEEDQKKVFPLEVSISKYSFIHLPKKLLQAWGLQKGKETRIIIDMQDNKLIISKA